MAISAAQQKELASLARAANRRLERATAGQRHYLESQIARYHVRQRPGGDVVFKQGKAATAAEYRTRMNELRAFMGAETSKRTGWDALKRRQIKAAGETIRAGGSDITDEELAAVLEEIGSQAHGSQYFYDVLANIEIAKDEARENMESDIEQLRGQMEVDISRARAAGLSEDQIEKIRSDYEAEISGIKFSDYWTPDDDTIIAAINDRRSEQQKALNLIRNRARRGRT